MSKPSIVLYHDQLLPLTGSFVLNQGEMLNTIYDAYYAGSRRVDGVQPPEERSFVISDGSRIGRARELLFKITRRPPRSFVNQIRNINPWLIHAHFGLDGTLILPTAHRLQIPLVTTFHGYDITLSEKFAPNRALKMYFRRRDELRQGGALFIAVSDFIRNRLIDAGFPQEKTVTHYIGVDTDLFRPDPSVTRENVLLYVGRFSAEKGCDHFIRTARLVQQECPEMQAVMIGDGPMRGDMEKRAKEARANIRFLGKQPHSVVRDWMRRSRIYCAPSTVARNGEEEAFGLSAVEAQASELPAVGFAVGGVVEAIKHGQTGLVAPDGDHVELARYICTIHRDNILYEYFAKEGRKRAVKMFNLSTQSALLATLYERYLTR